MNVHASRDDTTDLPLGACVLIPGIIVGRSEFPGKGPTYLVEFDRKGEAVQEWFHGDDLDED
ncbi:hypothetical protein ACG873_20975 [Mesorhizobium sp. AaZ16]|uniref:hypothetical protein n=1 Tax=Mesorhizobium sp. AaZ16 TaxID=3402289 RepID=UPI00374FA03B